MYIEKRTEDGRTLYYVVDWDGQSIVGLLTREEAEEFISEND